MVRIKKSSQKIHFERILNVFYKQKRTLVIKDSLLNMIPVVGVEPTLQRNTILSREKSASDTPTC